MPASSTKRKKQPTMRDVKDGPCSPLFTALPLQGNRALTSLSGTGISKELAEVRDHALTGNCVLNGIPFKINKAVVLHNKPVSVRLKPIQSPWLIFLHTSDVRPIEYNEHGFVSPVQGTGRLGEHAADYVFIYEDDTEVRAAIRRRYQIGPFQRIWGENCAECIPHTKQYSLTGVDDPTWTSFWTQHIANWSERQVRAMTADQLPWTNWLWSFENPHPEKTIKGIRFEPGVGAVIISGLAAGHTRSMPLRWEARKKVVLTLPKKDTFDPAVDEFGCLKQIRLDLGQVISAQPRKIYPNRNWKNTRLNLQPETSENEIVVEYAAHPEAHFHLSNDRRILVSDLIKKKTTSPLRPIALAAQPVKIRVIEKASKKPVPVKLHIHGQEGEYLQPRDRHRVPNPNWFEDYGAEYCHGNHVTVYIPGETVVQLPLGKVYIEVTKGFEIKPIRTTVAVSKATEEITLELDKVLNWREKGWVTADTHVHFLSPGTAMLEGAAEGVNVINLLASQWGELMTNVGDFDGKTTFGTREAGGDGEYLVRVGTENRQHVLGHISLLGYEGSIITPLCSGGPNEAAIGDPVDVLMTEWARQCRKQMGLVIMPHFPQPRLENAACLVLEEIDGVEMCSWNDHYRGIDPYSLSDWYRYFNNGYLVAAVGGTDKMSASTAVGTIRTYARIPSDQPFTYRHWMEAVKRCETFVSYGPLMEFDVEGQPMGSRIPLPATGGTVDLTWKVASTTIPMTSVELVVNGEIREGKKVHPEQDEGSWSLKLDKSSWAALLVRAKYKDKAEMIAAHSTPVMLQVKGSEFYSAADAVTILEQIEGAMAYLDTVGTRAETKRYKEMRLILESAHRKLHNRMHQEGHYHEHSASTDHAEHHH